MEFLIPALLCLQAVIWREVLMLPYRKQKMDEETLARLREVVARTRPSVAVSNTGQLWEVRRQRLWALAINLERLT